MPQTSHTPHVVAHEASTPSTVSTGQHILLTQAGAYVKRTPRRRVVGTQSPRGSQWHYPQWHNPNRLPGPAPAEPEEGGETVFPNGEWVDPAVGELHSEAGLSECAQQGVAVKPKKGDALLFWSLSPGDLRTYLQYLQTVSGESIPRGDSLRLSTWSASRAPAPR